MNRKYAREGRVIIINDPRKKNLFQNVKIRKYVCFGQTRNASIFSSEFCLVEPVNTGTDSF